MPAGSQGTVPGLQLVQPPCLPKCYLPLWEKHLKVGVFSEASLAPIPRSHLWEMLRECSWTEWVSEWKYHCTALLLHTKDSQCWQPPVVCFPSLGNHTSLALAIILSTYPFMLGQQPTISLPCFQLAIVQHFPWHSTTSLSFPPYHFPRSPNCLSLPNNAETASICWVPTMWQMFYMQNFTGSLQQSIK